MEQLDRNILERLRVATLARNTAKELWDQAEVEFQAALEAYAIDKKNRDKEAKTNDSEENTNPEDSEENTNPEDSEENTNPEDSENNGPEDSDPTEESV